VSQARVPQVKTGDVIRLEEPDYLYGIGPLLLRITAVGNLHREPDGFWLSLRGSPLHPDGRETGQPERYALVRLTAIRIRSQQQ
jgi:hypothetical protein